MTDAQCRSNNLYLTRDPSSHYIPKWQGNPPSRRQTCNLLPARFDHAGASKHVTSTAHAIWALRLLVRLYEKIRTCGIATRDCDSQRCCREANRIACVGCQGTIVDRMHVANPLWEYVGGPRRNGGWGLFRLEADQPQGNQGHSESFVISISSGEDSAGFKLPAYEMLASVTIPALGSGKKSCEATFRFQQEQTTLNSAPTSLLLQLVSMISLRFLHIIPRDIVTGECL